VASEIKSCPIEQGGAALQNSRVQSGLVELHETFCGAFNCLAEVIVCSFTGIVIMRIAILQSDPHHRLVIGEIVERLGHVCIPFSDGLAMSKSLSRSTVADPRLGSKIDSKNESGRLRSLVNTGN
jgi:hypothetical protein